MIDRHLITAQEFAKLARPVSVHLDEDEVTQFISECEHLYIIPAVGYGNFKAAVSDTTWGGEFDDAFKPNTAINGGEWTLDNTHARCELVSKELQYCVGLKKTLSYFVYAKMLRADGAIYSRAGFMQHDEQYSHHVDESKNKNYNDVMQIAEQYLGNCLQYLKYHSVDKAIQPVHSTRARIHAIGK